MRGQAATERLRGAGLRVTAPRLVVLQVLASASDHPDVDEIARRTRQQISVSTQAIYDVLDALTAAKLARRIEPAGSPARYEARVNDNHHHLVCRSCGRVVDVDCTVGAAPCLAPSIPSGVAAGFRLDEAEVTFWGVCTGCVESPPAPPGERATSRRTTAEISNREGAPA